LNLTVLESFDLDITYEARLSELTTFQLGGACKGFISCQTPNQLVKVIKQFNQNNLPFILIGGGSNLVVSDQGVDSYVIRYLSDIPIIERHEDDLIVAGSTSLDTLARYAVEQGLEGLNCTSGIPGTVGGAIVGNAGAFGKQVGDVLKQVSLISKTGVMKEVGPESLEFSYRHSVLKKTGDIVLSARITLKKGDKETLLREREDILRVREEKHPDLGTTPCAGSIFRNIGPTSKAGKRQAAGWFLDQAGAKELQCGGAAVFAKHANIIIKTDHCTAQDVFELSKYMAKVVRDKFDLELIREVRFVGKFEGMPADVQDVLW
jgi:UDP-N-acetylmuramate dehydrogenase